MNRAIMLSIQPKWCELIVSGKKTVEVRKTRPQIQTPFKVYIYKTFGKKKDSFSRNIQKYFNCGKVIGEFVCDKFDKYESEFWDDTPDYMDESHAMEQIRKSYFDDPDDWECEEEFEYVTGNEVDNPDDCELCKQSCLTYAEIRKYVGIGDKTFYGWHISDLKIYDKPKELWEYSYPCTGKKCSKCQYEVRDELPFGTVGVCCGRYHITRPPQSWMYVKEV